jgi:acyl-CoA reductase-like NAD-dependent aldehyde dehydrogenase
MATDTLASPATLGYNPMKVVKNFIDGEWVDSSTGETFENRNPADARDVVGVFQNSAKADVDAAVDAAKRAFAKWRLVPAPRRAEMIFRAAELLIGRKEEHARGLQRRGGAAACRADGSFGTAEQVCHGGAAADWRVRHDHAVEFPDGHFIVEAVACAGLRQHLRDQAGAGYTALDL